MKQIVHDYLKPLFIVIAGNLLYALTVVLFLKPSGLATGGTTGIALSLNTLWEIPMSGFVLIFNLAMLFLGFFILGKAFALTTLVSTFIYPLGLELWERLLGNISLTNDLLLCTIFSGLGIGISLGIVIRAGASTGGMDIPPLVLKKLFGIPVSASMYAFDFAILLVQAFFRPAENILYGIILILIYTMVLDQMLMLGSTRTEIRIASSKIEEIRQAILHEMDRGVTMLDIEGGYMRTASQMVLSVVHPREVLKMEKLIHKIDPECFMIINNVREVQGRGFSIKKEYR